MQGISVVIPVYNEEDNVAEGFREVTGVLARTGRPYEIIYVDDGSRDATVSRLLECAGSDPHLQLIQLRRNFGQTAAMAAGFDIQPFHDSNIEPVFGDAVPYSPDDDFEWAQAYQDSVEEIVMPKAKGRPKKGA